MKNRENMDIDTFIALLTSFYVDDFLHSVDDVNEARKIKKCARECLKAAGFDLIKWKSNVKELCDDSETNSTSFTDIEKEQSERTMNDDDDSESKYDEENEKERLNEEIKEAFSGDHQVDGIKMTIDDDPSAKALGVGYNFDTDELFIRVPERKCKEVETKREVLSFVCSMFDPIGIIAPFILKGRIYFQQTNLIRIQWKEKIPEEILKQFNK